MIQRRELLKALPAAFFLRPGFVRASVYFTSEEVQRQLFPAATSFEDVSVTLTKKQKKAIGKASKTRVSFDLVTALDAFDGNEKLGTLIIDQVYGKHEFITYAIALDNKGAVSGIEIMEYIETYGDEVRHPKWRAQFHGRKVGEPLEIDDQIKNISGATLSCVHITDGVRRVLVTHKLVLQDADHA